MASILLQDTVPVWTACIEPTFTTLVPGEIEIPATTLEWECWRISLSIPPEVPSDTQTPVAPRRVVGILRKALRCLIHGEVVAR